MRRLTSVTKGPGNFRYTDIAETRGCNPLSTTDHRLFIKGVSVNAKSLRSRVPRLLAELYHDGLERNANLTNSSVINGG